MNAAACSQLEFPTPQAATRTDEEALADFLVSLGDGLWHTAAQLGARSEQEKRVLRGLAEASDGEVISTNLGYKLTRCAMPDEFTAADDRLRAQARKMIRRRIRMRIAWNSAGRSPFNLEPQPLNS